MKILWVKSDFLHPTTRGGQIRTLEMLRRLHRRHEIHYVAFDDGAPEGIRRSREYCSKAYPVRHHVPPRRSARFAMQLIRGTFSRSPVSIERYRSEEMRRVIGGLLVSGFDSIVCDFLTPAVNFPDLQEAVLFQHNVESQIWDRLASNASNPASRLYLRRQARLMRGFERRVCQAVRHVVAVSDLDRDMFRGAFGVRHASSIPTGVDVQFFARPNDVEPSSDLVFVGSMDWLPNIDAMRFFLQDVLPVIRRDRPDCSLTIVGRKPDADLMALAGRAGNVQVTGTVEDVRPFLWGARLSIVPLRIGGGTRLKIYEAMAAATPVVSTTIGAEGLDVAAPGEIRLADTADEFAAACLKLLADPPARHRMAQAAHNLVVSRFSWDRVVNEFEAILRRPAADVEA
jgi:glycosyltransferase involved in cell wall biosynthesis